MKKTTKRFKMLVAGVAVLVLGTGALLFGGCTSEKQKQENMSKYPIEQEFGIKFDNDGIPLHRLYSHKLPGDNVVLPEAIGETVGLVKHKGSVMSYYFYEQYSSSAHSCHLTSKVSTDCGKEVYTDSYIIDAKDNASYNKLCPDCYPEIEK